MSIFSFYFIKHSIFFVFWVFLEGGVGNGVLTFVKWKTSNSFEKKTEKKDIPFLQNLHNRLVFGGFCRRGQCDSSPSKVNLIYEQKRSFLVGEGH